MGELTNRLDALDALARGTDALAGAVPPLTAALRDIDALCAAWDTTPTPAHEGFYRDGVNDGRYQTVREVRRILDSILDSITGSDP